jgi:hypothetical protein
LGGNGDVRCGLGCGAGFRGLQQAQLKANFEPRGLRSVSESLGVKGRRQLTWRDICIWSKARGEVSKSKFSVSSPYSNPRNLSRAERETAERKNRMSEKR